MRALPPARRYALAGAGGRVWAALSPGQWRAAKENYAAVLGGRPDDPAVRRVAARAFANYGRMLVDFASIATMTPEEIQAAIDVDGLEHIETALAAGRGCVLAIPHMGSWDFVGGAAASLGYPLLAVADPLPGSLDEAVVESRARTGIEIVRSGRQAVRRIQEALAANRLVALPSDLPRGAGVEVSFFGRRAMVPPGPSAFALRRGAPVITAFIRRQGSQHRVHLDPPVWAEEFGPGAGAATRLAQHIIHRFETFIRPYPDQWYAFRRMWLD